MFKKMKQNNDHNLQQVDKKNGSEWKASWRENLNSVKDNIHCSLEHIQKPLNMLSEENPGLHAGPPKETRLKTR